MMKREIILDTETTGLDPNSGHRVIEIGCVEVLGGIRSGAFFHSYLNPERDVPDDAVRVHGITTQFLKDKPIFAEKVEEFLEFIAEDILVIHNAGFDLRFMNAELARLGFAPIPAVRAVDTVLMARQKFPGAPASLDALCKRFEIDLSAREKHGALLDAELLAEVYLELTGGRQAALALETGSQGGGAAALPAAEKPVLPPRQFLPSAEELLAHVGLLAKIQAPLWLAEAE